MADPEKTAAPPQDVSTDQEGNEVVLPTGWRYKSYKFGPIRIPWYASPQCQVVLVAFVCFLCPGMFNALNGLGGGGQLSTKASTDANTALYSTFAVFGFLGGGIVNRIGIRWALSFGGLGYCVYVSAYLCYNHTANLGYITFGGFILGICAGILWAAQGAIILSYPPERLKGRYIAVFWMIFNLGGVIGALVPLGQNIHTTTAGTVTDGTYIGFLVLTFCGALLAFTLVNGNTVIRSDGSKVIMMQHPTWKSELLGMWQTLFTDPYLVLLFPMFFASNWFYTYHFNDVNAAKFDVRTRSLNSVIYWLAQIVGAGIVGFLLDVSRFKRTTRAKAAWVFLLVLTFVIWGGGYEFQRGYTRAEVTAGLATPNDPSDDYPTIDWVDSSYVGPMFLYIFYGMYDAIWQVIVYWYMGAISNNGRKLAIFAGFYKGLQSAGSAITWRIDGLGIPYMNYFASCWGLLAGSLLIALPVILLKIEDSSSVEDDLKFSDETAEDVHVDKREGSV